MNEIDELSRFRAEIPDRGTARAEEMFRTALHEDLTSERHSAPRFRNRLRELRPAWRAAIAVPLALGLAAGVLVTVLPSGTSQPAAPLTAKLLADRASAAALDGPTVPGGQWVYRKVLSSSQDKGIPARSTENTWTTADGSLAYLDHGIWSFGPGQTLYTHLSSLPADPRALDEYLAKLSYPNPDATQVNKDAADFFTIQGLLSTAVLPPSLNAELYQALADIPTIQVKSHVTDIDGRPGVAFVLPETVQNANLEIILDASDYSYLAQAAWEPSNGSPNSAIPFTEQAVLQTTLVSGPGSTRPDSAPPTQAMLTAEQAALAVLNVPRHENFSSPAASQWIYRKLSTSAGTQEVWARADDSEQASDVNGTLVTCAKSASCASGVTWLMPTGPAYPSPGSAGSAQPLPGDPQGVLDKLNTYRTGCADTSGDCDAVGVIANMLLGYGHVGISPVIWFFALADVPGVTVQHITDAAGRADVEFSFPFTDGVTGILVNASTYGFAGYIKDKAQTLLLQQADVSGPGVLPSR
ncbi:MAG TPA: CU044_5270 family protein [Streptosporangiaceae bacterium]|nr:CU044_5270 family protein [Streptosporangiaceae bacterium]